MLRVYQNLFATLNANELSYAVWKDCHQLQGDLEGSSDIDILVHPSDKEKFLLLMADHCFINAEYKRIQFPLVEHYYGYDQSTQKIAHLHVYFGLVTGESHIKSYHLPFEDDIFSRSYLNNLGLFQISFQDQALLYTIRHYIKKSSVIAYILWHRDKKGYKKEYDYILEGLTKSENDRSIDFIKKILPGCDFREICFDSNLSEFFNANRYGTINHGGFGIMNREINIVVKHS